MVILQDYLVEALSQRAYLIVSPQITIIVLSSCLNQTQAPKAM
jgi:hypothetical protein